MTLEEMRARMTAALRELGDLNGKSDRSADEESRMDTLLAEVNDLGPKIERQSNIANALRSNAQYGEVAERASAAQPAESERREVDLRTVGQRFVESDEYKRWLTMPRGSSAPVQVGSFFGRRYGFSIDGSGKPLTAAEMRAVVSVGGTATDSMHLPQVLPGIYRGAEKALVVRDVLMNAGTQSDALTIVQETGFTNSAAEVAEATAANGTGLTGGVKPESALTFAEVTYPVQTIAHWIPVTRQMLQDVPAMQGYINQRLLDGLRQREDNELLNGNGTAPNLRGLLQTSGVQILDSNGTTGYFDTNPVADAGQSNENLNRILRAKRLIRQVGAGNASFVVLNPADAETIQTITDGNRNYLFGGPAGSAQATLWGLPIVESENVAAKTALVGDGTMAGVFDRMAAQIFVTDSHADFFIRNLFAILAEERLALVVFRPEAFAKVTLV